MRFSYRFYHLMMLALVGALLVGCDQGRATPVPTPPIAAGVGCHAGLRVESAAAAPRITQAEAERSVLAQHRSPEQMGRFGALLDARTVRIVASDRAEERGRDIWLLVFAYNPPDGQPQTLPGPSGGRLLWQAYALVDAQTGAWLGDCNSPLPEL